jgi:hypothetical protein
VAVDEGFLGMGRWNKDKVPPPLYFIQIYFSDFCYQLSSLGQKFHIPAIGFLSEGQQWYPSLRSTKKLKTIHGSMAAQTDIINNRLQECISGLTLTVNFI